MAALWTCSICRTAAACPPPGAAAVWLTPDPFGTGRDRSDPAAAPPASGRGRPSDATASAAAASANAPFPATPGAPWPSCPEETPPASLPNAGRGDPGNAPTAVSQDGSPDAPAPDPLRALAAAGTSAAAAFVAAAPRLDERAFPEAPTDFFAPPPRPARGPSEVSEKASSRPRFWLAGAAPSSPAASRRARALVFRVLTIKCAAAPKILFLANFWFAPAVLRKKKSACLAPSWIPPEMANSLAATGHGWWLVSRSPGRLKALSGFRFPASRNPRSRLEVRH